MKIVFRDDDTCYYTDPAELEYAFGDLPNIPLSLSVVPFAAYTHAGTFPYARTRATEKYPDIAGNQTLVSYLKEGIQQGKFELMLHGIHHEYYETDADTWKTEMCLIPPDELRKGISESIKHLENVFDIKITTFIGPSNDIPANCAAILDNLGLHTNYMVTKHLNRHVSIDNIANYLRCNIFRLFTGQRYSDVLQYKNHQEICAFPFENYDKMVLQYEICKKFNQPLVIYTHYWSLNRNQNEKIEFNRFVDWIVKDGAKPVFMSQLWN